MLQSAKIIGTVLPTTGLIGTGVGIGVVFGALILGVSRNPALKGTLFSYAKLGFEFSEATRLFALTMAFLLFIYLFIFIKIYILKSNYINLLLKFNNYIKFSFINSDGKKDIYKILHCLLYATVLFYCTIYIDSLFLCGIIVIPRDNRLLMNISELLNPIDTSESSSSNYGGNAPNPGGNNNIIGNTEQDDNSNLGSNDNFVGNSDQRANSQQSTNPTEGNNFSRWSANNTLASNRTRSGIHLVHHYPRTIYNNPIHHPLINSNSIFASNISAHGVLRDSNYTFAGNTPVRDALINSNPTFTVTTPTHEVPPNNYNYNPFITPLKSESYNDSVIDLYGKIVTVMDPLNQGSRGFINPNTGELYHNQRPFCLHISDAMLEVYNNGRNKTTKRPPRINLNNYDTNSAKYIHDFMDYMNKNRTSNKEPRSIYNTSKVRKMLKNLN